MSLPKAFFLVGAVCALIGMAWGIQMSATHNHNMAPAHAHLNLIGFVLMSIWGGYYAVTPHAATRLGWIHFALAVASVVVLVPGIYMAIGQQKEALAKLGSVITILTMAFYAVIVLRNGAGPKA